MKRWLRQMEENDGGKRVTAQSCPTFVAPWSVACQAPLSMEFSSREYWNALLFPPPGDLPDPGIKPMSPALAGGFFTTDQPIVISTSIKLGGNLILKVNRYKRYIWVLSNFV